MPRKILVADDEPLYLQTTGDLLRASGYECVCVPDMASALNCLHEASFDLVLTDLNMPGNMYLELLKDQSEHRPRVPIVVVTVLPTLPSAIESIRLGIADYLLKPVKFKDLLVCIRRVLALGKQETAIGAIPIRGQCALKALFPQIIGDSKPMLELFEIIDRVARTDTSVLITDESGTGKEVVASTIHQHSYRNQGKFQIIDCTVVPEMLLGHKKGSFKGAVGDVAGLLKQCDGGTAFFDELSGLPVAMQAKLLQAVQEQTFIPVGSRTPVTVNTRFVCATKLDLALEVAAGRFRQDLFYRLGVIHVSLPPLRDRGDDILLLADAFLKNLRPKGSSIDGFSQDAYDELMRHPWPGNIRELRDAIKLAITLVRGDMVMATDLPEKVRSSSLLPAAGSSAVSNGLSTSPASPAAALPNASHEQAMKAAEYEYLVGLIQQHRGNVSEASRQAGLSRQGLHKLLKRHDINASESRS